jgi:hypothetical protein
VLCSHGPTIALHSTPRRRSVCLSGVGGAARVSAGVRPRSRHEQPSTRFKSITTGGSCCGHRICCRLCRCARDVGLVDRALCYPRGTLVGCFAYEYHRHYDFGRVWGIGLCRIVRLGDEPVSLLARVLSLSFLRRATQGPRHSLRVPRSASIKETSL